MPETDREKFIRLGTARVNKALEAIRLVGNLSNRSNYAYTERDVDRIFRALGAELKACREKFDTSSARGGRTFSLD